MNIKFEYILFIIIVLYFTLKELLKGNNDRKSNKVVKNSISVMNSEYKEINGTYLSLDKLFNKALVYKNEEYDYWIFKVIEKVSKNEENCFWVLANINPENLNNNVYSEKNTIYHSINVVDIGDFYVYQYIDFGNCINSNDYIMFDKSNPDKKIKIIIL